MKKLMLLAAAAAFGLSSVNAQEVKFGAKAGLNLSTIGGDFGVSDFDEDTNTKSKVGFHVGGLAEIVLSDKFSIQPELLFSQQGAKIEYSFSGFPEDNYDVETTLSYINLPIMAKFYPIENLSIEAGPQFGFLISDKDVDSDDGTISGEGAPEYKSFDYGLNIGAGYKLDNGVMFQIRYNVGLAKIDDVPNDIEGFGVFGSTFSRKNRVLQLSVGYMF